MGRGSSRVGLCLLAAVWSVSALAVQVDLPHKGPFEVWFDDAEGRPLGKKQEIKGLSRTDVPIPDGAPKTLVVRDVERNNLALISFSGKPVVAKLEDFKYAAEVKVTVEHRGKAVASAVVLLKDATGEKRELLSPDMKGVVVFPRVRLGEVTAQVEYRVKGEERKSGKLTLDLTAERSDAVPVIAFSIPDEVSVVGDEGAEPEAATRPVAKPSSGFSLGAVVTYMLALAVGVGALYGLFRFVQAREKRMREMMQKLGVQPPSDVGDAPDAGTPHTSGFRSEPPPKAPLVPEGTCPFCGQPKGADGSCGCSLTASAPVPAPSGKPRLVVLAGPCAGRTFDLAAAEAVLGRDPGCELSLAEDSSVSRRHAKVSLEGGVLWVEDLGSTNGTYVNGVKVEGRTKVSHGDALQFGESRLRYEG
ncbi:MAG: hypothetical protein AMXMBFR61_18540 [Fimbriimonadales bacterium]